jgi:hypothetical protein
MAQDAKMAITKPTDSQNELDRLKTTPLLYPTNNIQQHPTNKNTPNLEQQNPSILRGPLTSHHLNKNNRQKTKTSPTNHPPSKKPSFPIQSNPIQNKKEQ